LNLEITATSGLDLLLGFFDFVDDIFLSHIVLQKPGRVSCDVWRKIVRRSLGRCNETTQTNESQQQLSHQFPPVKYE
jgi:hypothetical protein